MPSFVMIEHKEAEASKHKEAEASAPRNRGLKAPTLSRISRNRIGAQGHLIVTCLGAPTRSPCTHFFINTDQTNTKIKASSVRLSCLVSIGNELGGSFCSLLKYVGVMRDARGENCEGGGEMKWAALVGAGCVMCRRQCEMIQMKVLHP